MMGKSSRILHSAIEGFIRNIAGGLGQRIRYVYYRRRFHSCGTNVRIGEGVIIENPQNISIGSDVWLLPYSILTGPSDTPIPASRIVVRPDKIETNAPSDRLLEIGSETSLGAYNIVHGFGGLRIGSRVTTSARVSLYSFSHLPYAPDEPGLVTYANAMVRDAPIACIASPIELKDGVWLGLGVAVFGGVLGENAFVGANSVVMGNLPANTVADGSPARVKRPRFGDRQND
ncbi:hypothetical protein MALG_02569 [Marinovum algicola DG 898]|nr:hypothetical protein MALG_02569 [Marinovum algicola DG 898]